MNNYKLSGEIRKENKQINAITELLMNVRQSGRRLNGDTLSDTIGEMDFTGREDMYDVLDGVRQEFDRKEIEALNAYRQ